MEKIKKKVVVLGEPSVGKTCLVRCYCSNGQNVPKEYHMTQVSDVASKIIELEDDKDVELFFFDLSGRNIYRKAVKKLASNPDLVVLVFDLTSDESFKNLKNWVQVLKEIGGSDSPGVLIGTKSDLESLQVINKASASDFAKQQDMEFFEVSCGNYEMVDKALSSLVQRVA